MSERTMPIARDLRVPLRPQVVFAITHTEPGGLREIWHDVANGLLSREFRTGLVALYPRGEESSQARQDGWHFITTKPMHKVLAGLGLLWATIVWLRKTRPEVVVSGMPFCNVLFALSCSIARTGTKVILSHHTPSHTYAPWLNWIDQWTGCRRCVVGVISVSDAVGASFVNWPAAYRAKQCTIRNSLPEKIEQLADDAAAARPRERVWRGRIIAVGRLSHQKNHPQLIRAMVHVPQAQLEIIGAGEDEAELRGLIAQLGLENRITLSGRLAREETLRRVAQADVFVQVSRFEGHSLALIEAARLGLPLVVSQVDEQIEGVTDAKGEVCGITVPLDDERALGASLCSLLDDPATYRTWEQRSAQLKQICSSQALIDRYAALLSRVGIEADHDDAGSTAMQRRETTSCAT